MTNTHRQAGRVGQAGLVGLMALVGLASALAAQSRYPVRRDETISRTMQFSGSAARMLEVSTVNGAIRVVGYDGDDVAVVVRKTVRADTDADAQAAETAVALEFAEGANEIWMRGDAAARPGCDKDTVHARGWGRGRPRYQVTFDFDVRVPRGTVLRLCTINKGDIHVEGTSGDFAVDNVNGAITLTAIGGAGRAVTVNGDVTASFVDNPKSAVLFKSVNGDLDATFPRTLAADLRMKTFNGGLYTDFDVASVAAATPVAERRGGRFVYRTNRFTSFRVGRGGPELTFDAFNGDVRVLSRD